MEKGKRYLSIPSIPSIPSILSTKSILSISLFPILPQNLSHLHFTAAALSTLLKTNSHSPFSLPRNKKACRQDRSTVKNGADDGIRTLDFNLG